MSDSIHSRQLAEQLTTLAGLLEAEAIKAHVLGLHTNKNLGAEAQHARELADLLWQANAAIELEQVSARQESNPSMRSSVKVELPQRRGRRRQMKLVSA